MAKEITKKINSQFNPTYMGYGAPIYAMGGNIKQPHGDPYEYKKEGDKYYTRKKGNKTWILTGGKSKEAIASRVFKEDNEKNINKIESADTAKEKNAIKGKQQMLVDAGYDIGKTGVDGVWGRNSQAAFEKYMTDMQNKESIVSPSAIDNLNINNPLPLLKEKPINQEFNIHGRHLQAKMPVLEEYKEENKSAKKAKETVGGKVRDFAARNMPSSVGKSASLMAADFLNIEDIITDKSISKEGKSFLQGLAIGREPGVYNFSGDYKKTYGAGMSDYKNMSKGAKEISTKLGQFSMKVNEDGSIEIIDQYNFNAQDEDSTIGVKKAPTREEVDALQKQNLLQKMLSAGKLASNQEDPYDMVRYGIAPVFGSTNDEGAPVNIKLAPMPKAMGGAIPTYGLGSWIGQDSEGENPNLDRFNVASGAIGAGAGVASQFVGSLGKGKGASAGSGALQGLAAGSMFGPIGMGIGALAGGAMGLIQHRQQQQAERGALRQQRTEQLLNNLPEQQEYLMAYGGKLRPIELKNGIKEEMEHTKSKKVARRIAKEHLEEHPDYYSKLKKAGLADSYPMGGSIDNGGTHEQNPLGGVPIGNKGLVEEGEYIWESPNGKYVFSNRY